jgi:CheY-like chemotaxis protein/tetratricopeptide (TPR) repeat protein
MTIKILVAEDDRHTRRILDHIFTKDPAFRGQQTQLFLASDGEEALKLFEKETPDLVISDLLMPRLDGFALCRAIRRLPQGKDVPVIVTSAIYKETALLNRMRDELGVEFFAKPFQVRELVRGVQRLLERSQRSGKGERSTRQTGQASPAPGRQTGTLARSQGQLGERPLATLLFDLLEEQATGVLTLRRGRIKKEIYVIHGVPVGAESNIRTETLGHYLVARRVLDEQQHQQALRVAKEQHKSLMEAVVSLGWLSETDVFRHHTALVKLKIINSLRWHDGGYAFTTGDTFSDRIPKATIDITHILLLGLQRVTSLDEAARKLDGVANRAVRLTLRAERYHDAFAKVFGTEVLSLLPTQPTLNQMLRKGVESLKVYLHTHALLESGMAELGEVKEEESAPVRAEDPIGLKQLKHEATRSSARSSAGADAQEGPLYEEIFGVDEISVVTAMPVPDPAAGRPPMDSGEVSIDIQLEDEAQPAADQLSTEEARKLVVSTYLGIHDKDLYELLGVERTAGPPQIRAAYARQAETFKMSRFVDCDLGLDHPKLEEINQLLQRAHDVLMDPAKRATYDEDLRNRETTPRVDPLEAEARFRQGQQALTTGDPERARQAFAEVLEIDPDSPDYHAHLGWATYLARPDDPGSQLDASGHLDQALAINPDELSALLYYGQMCARTNNPTQAVEYLERALDVDPAHVEAFEELARIHSAAGDWRLLERQHRLVLHRLGSRQSERVVTLWKRLAAVYRDHLDDPESARTSLEVAANLAPEDEEIRAALAELDRPDPRRWQEEAAALREQLAAHPDDPDPYRRLLTLYQGAGRPDAAYLAASVLVTLGAAPEEAAHLHRQHRPRFLVRIRREMDAELWGRIRHPDDDPDTSALFETLASLPPETDLEVPPPSDPGRLVPAAQLPAPFARVLGYGCELLSLPTPPVHVRAAPEIPATIFDPLHPHLLVDEQLLTAEDPLALAAQLMRRLPYFWAGRAFGLALSSKQLRAVLMGAMKLVAPRLAVEDPEGTIGRIHQRLQQAPETLRTQLTEVISGLTRERSSLNITRWMRGLARSADRLALVVTGDLPTLLSHHPAASKAEVLGPLREYAVSEAHQELREQLATSIAV